MTEPMCFCILCGCFYYALYELELCLKDFEENEEEIFPMRCAVMQICDLLIALMCFLHVAALYRAVLYNRHGGA